MMWNKSKESQWILGSSGYHDGNDPQFHTESVRREFSQEHVIAWERDRERDGSLGYRNDNERGFSGGPVVKTSPSNTRGARLIPGRGAKISHALWPKNQNIKQKQYCNKFNKDFQNGPHQKKKKS